MYGIPRTKIIALSIILLLANSACSKKATPIPTLSAPTAISGSETTTVVGVQASGVVVPRQKAKLSFTQNGQIQRLLVKSGDAVQAGQVIAELAGKEALQAAVTSAELEALSAQQALDDLYSNAPLVKAQAFEAIAAAYAEVRQAEYQLYYFLAASNLSGVNAIQSVEITQSELEKARQAFDAVRYKSESDPTRRALKEKLDNAESNHQAALRRLELESRLMTAQANLEKAKADFERVKDGPDPRQVELAQARQRNAQAQLEKARAALEQATLKAPFSGVITALEVSEGETVLAGSVVAVLGNLSDFVVETADLSEKDISRVHLGQKAVVYIEALQEEVEGQVVEIAPQANILGGDVVYTVTVALVEQPQGLRWGMSAEVEIPVEE